MHHDIQIARRSPAKPSFTVPLRTQPRPCVHARGYLDLDLGQALAPSCSAAGLAGILDDAPRAFAPRAGLGDAKNTARGHNLSAPFAGRARPGFRVAFPARAVADIAAIEFSDTNFLFRAVSGLGESN